MAANRKKRVTLIEVSRLAKVSPMSASRVLNSRAPVKESTRQAVLKAARQLGYTTDGLARAMRTGRTGNIGLILPPIPTGRGFRSSAYYLQMLEGLELGLLGHEYNVLISMLTSDEIANRQVPRIVASRYVDGVIFLNLSDYDYVQTMVRRITHVVGMHMRLAEGYPCVHASNHEAGRLMARHLWNLGHRRAGMVALLARPNQRERSESFMQTLEQLGGEVSFVIDVSNWDDRDFLNVEQWLPVWPGGKDRTPPTALVCSNDFLAARILKLVVDAGLRVPEDLSIAGFERQDFGLDVTPTLTTVDFDKRKMSLTAVELLVSLLGGERPDPIQVGLPVTLMPRQSTGPAARAALL